MQLKKIVLIALILFLVNVPSAFAFSYTDNFVRIGSTSTEEEWRLVVTGVPSDQTAWVRIEYVKDGTPNYNHLTSLSKTINGETFYQMAKLAGGDWAVNYLKYTTRTDYNTTVVLLDASDNVMDQTSFQNPPSGSSPTPTSTAAASPTPTPTPTGGGDTTPPAPPGIPAVTVNSSGNLDIAWGAVADAASYNVYIDGQKVNSSPISGTSLLDQTVPTAGMHQVQVSAVDDAGNESFLSQPYYVSTDGTGGDTGGGTTCDGCTAIQQMLECPEWDQYMGEWGNVIRNNVPPAPDWQQVANTFRDTVVPAMGQAFGDQLVSKAPVIADAIGDDLESREKPVPTPGPLPSFAPSVPTLTDLPAKIEGSLTDNVPAFEPDYTESKPFTIPDPLNIDMNAEDKGYKAIPTPTPGPSYRANGFPNYQGGKEYQMTNTTSQEPAPSYKTSPTASQAPPDYKTPTTGPAPSYQPSSGSSTVPEYQVKP